MNLSEVQLAEGLPFLAVLFSFLLGSIPFGVLVARIFHARDPREQGSGNIGATNVTRLAGFWPAGFLTFLMDFLKGFIPCLLVSSIGVQHWVATWPASLQGESLVGTQGFTLVAQWAVGLFAVIGHCYSPWLVLKGGKGVATGFGALTVLSPAAALGGVIGYGIAFLYSRIGSLASLFGILVASATYLVLNSVSAHVAVGAAMIFVILLRHEDNIDALLENREEAIG